MKNLKKLASLLLALVMVLSLATTVFAASKYTITIENSITDKTYSAYKVFDATYSGDNVSYTIASSDAWYTLVSGEASPFQLTETTTTGTYFVSLKDGKEDSDVADWFNAIETVPGSAAATGTGNAGALTLDVGAAGYYYITTTAGSNVTVTTAKPTATVIEKNQEPGNVEKTVSDTEAQIGDTVNYTITAKVPAYDGGTEITSYTFVDTLSTGLTAPAAADVTVQILNNAGDIAHTLTTGITVEKNTITITYDPTAIENYPADATIKIIYTATVNTAAAYANNNTVTQTWTGDSTSSTDSETVYTYGFNLQKVKDDKTTQLDGAIFELYTSNQTTDETTIVKFTKNEAGDYVVDPNGTVTEIEVGKAKIWGLDADVTYYLKETKAPAGYNMLTELVEVKVGQENAYDTTTGMNTNDTKVENKAGSLLPSTGGMGTTLFYALGGILMLAAVVLLVTKKRMAA